MKHSQGASSSEYGIGFDIGGSALKCVAVDSEGIVQYQSHFVTLDSPLSSSPCQYPLWAEKVLELLHAVERRMGSPAVWVGVAAPGLAAPDHRWIAHMPGRMEGLERLDWTALLERDTAVPVLNDAQAALLGECWRGAGKGLNSAILLTLGTGVGGAILHGGKLLSGAQGRAGHLGHISLNLRGEPGITGIPGSLEQHVGESSLPARTQGKYRTTRALIEAHLRGDLQATEWWLASVYALACGLASLINVIDPEAVIIGGGISHAGETLFEPLRQYLDQVEWRPGGHQVPLLAAQLGEFAGALGAARFALERMGRESAS